MTADDADHGGDETSATAISIIVVVARRPARDPGYDNDHDQPRPAPSGAVTTRTIPVMFPPTPVRTAFSASALDVRAAPPAFLFTLEIRIRAGAVARAHATGWRGGEWLAGAAAEPNTDDDDDHDDDHDHVDEQHSISNNGDTDLGG